MDRVDIIEAVQRFNESVQAKPPPIVDRRSIAKDVGLDWQGCNTQLVVYGSLAPGEVNHDQLASLKGSWQSCRVRGQLQRSGWGSAYGFPGFRWDETSGIITGQLFTSLELPNHWERLDAFEGEDYVRLLVPVEIGDGMAVANIYSIAP